MLSSNIVVKSPFAEKPVSCIFYVGTAFKGQTLSYSHVEHIALKSKITKDWWHPVFWTQLLKSYPWFPNLISPHHWILRPFRQTLLVDWKRAYAERPSDIGVQTIKYDTDLLLTGYLVLLDGYHPVWIQLLIMVPKHILGLLLRSPINS